MNFCRDVSCYRSNRYLLHTKKKKDDDIHGNHFFTTNRENSAHCNHEMLLITISMNINTNELIQVHTTVKINILV